MPYQWKPMLCRHAHHISWCYGQRTQTILLVYYYQLQQSPSQNSKLTALKERVLASPPQFWERFWKGLVCKGSQFSSVCCLVRHLLGLSSAGICLAACRARCVWPAKSDTAPDIPGGGQFSSVCHLVRRLLGLPAGCRERHMCPAKSDIVMFTKECEDLLTST